MRRSIKLHMLSGLAVLLVFAMVACATQTEAVVSGETARSAPSVPSGGPSQTEAGQRIEPQTALEAPRIEETAKAPEREAEPIAVYSFDSHGHCLNIKAYDGHADLTYPGFVTEAEISAAAKAALEAYPDYLKDVRFEVVKPGETRVSYASGLRQKDMDYAESLLGDDLKWFVDRLFAPASEVMPEVQPEVPSKTCAENETEGTVKTGAAKTEENDGMPVADLPLGGGNEPKTTPEAARAASSKAEVPPKKPAPDVASQDEASSVVKRMGGGLDAPGVASKDEAPAAGPSSSVVFARIPVRLDGEEIHLRTKQTNLGTLICRAMTEKSRADFAAINGGSIKGSLAKGDLTPAEVEAVLAPGAQLVVVELTGARIYEMFGFSQKDWPEPFEGYLQTNLQIVSIPQEGGGRKILKIFLGGEPIDKSKLYRCATSDYLMGGGAGCSGFELPDLGNFKLFGEFAPILVQWLGETYPPQAGSGSGE